MAESIITCPKCQHPIPLTSAIEGPIAERLRLQFETQAQANNEAITLREQAVLTRLANVTAAEQAQEQKLAEALRSGRAAIAAKQTELDDARAAVAAQVAEGVKSERARILAQAVQEAAVGEATVLADLQAKLSDKAGKLVAAQQLELDLRKQRRELEERGAAFELEMTRKLDAERGQIKADAQRAADDANRLKEAEKDKKISDMLLQMEEMRRKAEQGSQQTQGEVLELELEAILRETFPQDQIVPVPKGVFGGDVTQRVVTPQGVACGSILWESKRTKTWSDGWIAKLKDDQRAAKADVAIIVSTTLPKDVDAITNIDGVWVVSREAALGVAMALRFGILQIADAKRADEGKHDKMNVLWRYLSGHEFRQRVEAIVEAFTIMRRDLDQEKTVMTRVWAKREKQIERVMASTTGMHGDLAAILGGALPKIAAVELPALLASTAEAA